MINQRKQDAGKQGTDKKTTAKRIRAGKRLLVVLLTYNEAKNLKPLVESIITETKNKWFDTGILVVDDNSPDGTGELAESLSKKHRQVHVIRRSGKFGLGTAYVDGFRFGLTKGFDFIMTMDCDFSHDPKDIPGIAGMMKDCDIAIGSRYTMGGGISNWSISRRLLSRFGNIYIRLMLGMKIKDCTAGFRCYRRELLSKINLGRIFSPGYFFLEEILYRSRKAGAVVGEYPVVFKDRTAGETKISKKEMKMALSGAFMFFLDRTGLKRLRYR